MGFTASNIVLSTQYKYYLVPAIRCQRANQINISKEGHMFIIICVCINKCACAAAWQVALHGAGSAGLGARGKGWDVVKTDSVAPLCCWVLGNPIARSSLEDLALPSLGLTPSRVVFASGGWSLCRWRLGGSWLCCWRLGS